MGANPRADAFRNKIEALKGHKFIKPHLKRGVLRLQDLDLEHIATLIKGSQTAAYYFFLAATSLNRTTLKEEMEKPEAKIVASRVRKAFALKRHFPEDVPFEVIAARALGTRTVDLARKRAGGIEQLFRDRLKEEGIGIEMTSRGNLIQIPGLLVGQRKPDGAYPHPKTKKPPRIYLEVKKIKRVSDDIQKRMYEIAEASLEMKLLYGDIKLKGFNLNSTEDVASNSRLRAAVRSQIEASTPVVVVLLLCPTDKAERYREGLEAFVDRVFFQEEIDECLEFLKETVERFQEEDD